MRRPGRFRWVTLAEAAVEGDQLAQAGSERELADLRTKWSDELESAARSTDFRQRAVAFRAIGQFRWRAKEELLRRGLDDESPAARGSALLSLELMSRDHPSTINGVRPLLHNLATADGNAAVRRLAILCLKNGSADRNTIVLLEGLAQDDEADAELRRAAGGVAQQLKRKQSAKRS
jgi:HEAT repeat protein